jgi:hypothetical protein
VNLHARQGAPFGRSSDLQARTYSLLLPGPERTSAIDELSFLLTAAGQSQNFTGFPFQLPARAGNTEPLGTRYRG